MYGAIVTRKGTNILAKLVAQGEPYGLKDSGLVAKEALVLFYKQSPGSLWFINSYYAKTLVERDRGQGLMLDSSRPDMDLTFDELKHLLRCLALI